MAYWRFSDGTMLYSGARVEGNRPFADHLRTELYGLAHGEGPLVWLHEKDGAVALLPQNDWLLDAWARNEAHLAQLEVESDYTAQSSDIPLEVLEHLRRRGASGLR